MQLSPHTRHDIKTRIAKVLAPGPLPMPRKFNAVKALVREMRDEGTVEYLPNAVRNTGGKCALTDMGRSKYLEA